MDQSANVAEDYKLNTDEKLNSPFIKTTTSMSKVGSYAERRLLFKNIWDTAMLDDKVTDMIKPKVIKTLRLDDMDKYVKGKSKKEKLKSLRAICNKILDFCDRHENDLLHQQITGEPRAFIKHSRPRKRKIRRHKKLLMPSKTEAIEIKANPTTSGLKDDQTNANTSIKTSFRVNNLAIVGRALISNYSDVNDLENINTDKPLSKKSTTRRRLVRKKRTKRKRKSELVMHPQSGTSKYTSAKTAAVKGCDVITNVKQLLARKEIVISKPNPH